MFGLGKKKPPPEPPKPTWLGALEVVGEVAVAALRPRYTPQEQLVLASALQSYFKDVDQSTVTMGFCMEQVGHWCEGRRDGTLHDGTLVCMELLHKMTRHH
jgi:hypothetical protein